MPTEKPKMDTDTLLLLVVIIVVVLGGGWYSFS